MRSQRAGMGATAGDFMRIEAPTLQNFRGSNVLGELHIHRTLLDQKAVLLHKVMIYSS